MPTYEYGCQSCGYQWELEQRISEAPVKTCPQCKKTEAQRLISGGNFILKGSGWYADLYHKPSGSKASTSSSDSSSSGGDSSASSTASETKKTETKKAANE